MTGNNHQTHSIGAAITNRGDSFIAYLVAAQTQSFRLAASLANTGVGLPPAGASLIHQEGNR